MKKSLPTAANTRRIAYSLAAGAAAFSFTGKAEATVIYSGLQNISIGQGASQNLDLNLDTLPDVLLKNYVFGGGNYQGATVNFAPGKLVGFTSGLTYVSALGSGVSLNAGSFGSEFSGSMAYGANNPNAQFNNASNAFIGLVFPDISSAIHYGWVRVAVNNAAGTFVIKDWAYESQAGASIATGDGIPATAAPEPTTLGLLAAGATGLLALRRRKAQE